MSALVHLHLISDYQSCFRLRRVFVACLAVLAGCGPAEPVRESSSPNSTPAATQTDQTHTHLSSRPIVDAPPEMLAERRRLDQSVWAEEQRSHIYESVLVRFWDDLLAQGRHPKGDKFSVFKAIPLKQIHLGLLRPRERLQWGIEISRMDLPKRNINHDDWIALLERYKQDGYRLVQSEWHHARFEGLEEGPRSTVAMVLHVANDSTQERFILRGNLQIRWSAGSPPPQPEIIDASDLEVLSRTGPPAFEEILTVNPSTPGQPEGVHPVIAYDLNGDGLSEILLGQCNRLYWNEGGGRFKQDRLFAQPAGVLRLGIVADFTGDGIPDYINPSKRGGLLFYEGDPDGRFTTEPRGRGHSKGPIVQPQVFTAGDIDRDGDLDLWVGQYQPAYLFGQMPTPYYDANDGLPSFLLHNDGQGNFQDITESAGLAPKQHRRTYGSSFIDLDDDGDLDLLVVSDFAGIDIHHNDGTGRFTDVTHKVVQEWHNFGMSVSFGDYNADGFLDFYISGMGSTTARRLEQMNLGRPDMPEENRMRPIMGYGNRMYLARGRRFVEPAFRDQVNRTGWTWGATSFDFDNDGDEDIYVANGHSSGASTKDHCTNFWCHDIYTNSSEIEPDRARLFKSMMQGFLNRTESWDGYQKNVLLMNQDGTGFVNVAFLMGLAKEYDARSVVGDDLDGDGRVDLLVSEDNWKQGSILHVYRNRLETNNHWIGVRLREEGQGHSPLGARVLVHTSQRRYIGRIVAGDSLSSQHATTLHFGLGRTQEVDSIEVRWVNGSVQRIEGPEIDRYHLVRAP